MKNFIKVLVILLLIFVIFLLSSCPINPDDDSNKNENDNNKTSNSLVEFLTLLQTTAVSGGSYIYELKVDEVITPQNLSYIGKENITITLRGDNTNRTISLSTNGAMFTVRSGVTLVLDNNLTLQGRVSNNNALVVVAADAMLIMNHGVIITGNTNTNSRGGGVVLSFALGQNEGGKFIMNGGEIINNKALGAGGGVAISSTAVFTMKNGKINGNSTVTSLLTTTGNGGGVFAYGNFVMEGGEISGNSVSVSSLSANEAHGGGVYNERFFSDNGTWIDLSNPTQIQSDLFFELIINNVIGNIDTSSFNFNLYEEIVDLSKIGGTTTDNTFLIGVSILLSDYRNDAALAEIVIAVIIEDDGINPNKKLVILDIIYEDNIPFYMLSVPLQTGAYRQN